MAQPDQAVVAVRIYRFGPFEVLADTAELRKNGVRLKLYGQPCQILLMLLQARGEVVTREALRCALWSADTFVDFEHSLNTAVKKLRQALGDNADQPVYIETVPRVGYRFLAPVNLEAGEAFGAPTLVPSPPISVPRKSRHAHIAFAMLAILLLVLVAFSIRGFMTPHALRITGTRQLTFHAGDYETLSLAGDGHRVYFFKCGDTRIFSVSVAGGDESASAETRFVSPIILDISPDGTTLLIKEYAASSPGAGYSDRLWLQPTAGGPARPLGDVQVDFAAAFSPDGKTIAFAQKNAIFFTTDQGATFHPVIQAPGVVQWIRFSPDGQSLRFTVVDLTTNLSAIWEARPGGKPRLVPIKLNPPGALNFGAWTRDGKYFLVQSTTNARSDYWSIPGSRGWFESQEPLQLASAGEIVNAFPSPIDDQIFVVEHESMTVTYRFDPAHRVFSPFLSDRSVEDPAFSRDGKWITYVDQHGGRNVLMRARAEGNDAVPLTDPGLYARFPHFSPDGKRIAFMGKWVDKPWQIFWVSTDGGALHEMGAPSVVNQADVNWMPGGEIILFGQTPWYMADPNAPRAIYLFNLRTGDLQKVPNTEDWFSPRISPDGRSFVALSRDERKLGLYDFSTAKWRILLENSKRIGAPYWAPDGKAVYANTHGKEEDFNHDGMTVRVQLSDLKAETILTFDQYVDPRIPCNSWGLAPDRTLTISCWKPNANIYALQYE